jgi:hypothetical protein
LLGLQTEIYLHNKGGRSGDNCKIKHMIQLCNAENQETADRTTQDSLKMQGLLEADNVPGTEEWETQFCLYREFCVLNVVGKSTMKKMGENYAWGIRESYDDTIKPIDKAFAMLCLEDRWKLWAKISEMRAEEEGNDGSKSLKGGELG